MNKFHFIGIGGIGMSGLARILLKKKIIVSGSDIAKSYVTEGLEREGAKVYLGHSPLHISSDMTVVYSSDIKKENPEYVAAHDHHCRMLHRSDLLAEMIAPSKAIAIAGTHGKTTTSALMASILIQARLDPSYAVGGVMPGLDSHAHEGKGDYFVVEADESDGTFLKYSPFAALVTNIDNDHLDYYKSEEELIKAFKKFIDKVPSEKLIYCGDDVRLTKLCPKGISYGFNDKADLQISNYRMQGWNSIFDIKFQGRIYKDLQLSLIGKHNCLNASAAFALAIILGVKESDIREALKTFKGVKRRCEIKGEVRGVQIFDDYAHHPSEVKATLEAIRESVRERKIIVIFQPHRYSRTKECLGSYGKIFDAADEIFITNIYGAQELPIPGVHAEAIVKEVHDASLIPCHLSTLDELKTSLKDIVRPHDVVVCLGAGDITKFASELPTIFKVNPPRKYRVGVVFGGKSAEHEISLLSAHHIEASLFREYYDVVCFGILPSGAWVGELPSVQTLEYPVKAASNGSSLLSPELIQSLNACDLFFPVLHGPFGEDGTIQGFFDILGKPHVGCDYRSSAICMDKALTKRLMILNGIPTASFIDFDHYRWKTDQAEILKQIAANLHYPLFVKPTHLGSAIGVSKVEKIQELIPAIELAFRKDTHVLVENGMVMREIEFAVLGNHWVHTFPPGEVCTNGQFYDYNLKYGPEALKSNWSADLSEELITEGKFLAEEAYKVAGCKGMARVDFFLDPSGKFWLNEINPIPGFTGISLFPKICEVNGLDAQSLMNHLIILAMERKRYEGRVELK